MKERVLKILMVVSIVCALASSLIVMLGLSTIDNFETFSFVFFLLLFGQVCHTMAKHPEDFVRAVLAYAVSITYFIITAANVLHVWPY